MQLSDCYYSTNPLYKSTKISLSRTKRPAPFGDRPHLILTSFLITESVTESVIFFLSARINVLFFSYDTEQMQILLQIQ